MPNQSTDTQSKNSPETLFKQVSQSAWLVRICDHIRLINSLQALFELECPLELTGKCQVTTIIDATLTIYVENASLAMQLQYRTRELLLALKRYPEFSGLKKIRVKIAAKSPIKACYTART